MSAADIGGSEGRDSIYLAEHRFEVTAMDISPAGLEKAE